MTLQTTPWLIGGGAVHDPSIARTLSFAATSGTSGIVQPPDLRVSALATPSGVVRIAGGTAVILGDYPSQTTQSYIARNDGVEDVAIPATSNSSRSDLVILRIDDPEFSGTTPADVTTYEYARFERVPNVGANAESAEAYVDYPHITLARIDIPALTGAITNAMVTDLRKMANPRRARRLYTHSGTPGSSETLTSTDNVNGQTFPAGMSGATVAIPSWARSAVIRYDLANIVGPASGGANFVGWAWLMLGTQQVALAPLDRPTTNDDMRLSTVGATTLTLPAGYAGTTKTLTPKAYLISSSASAARPWYYEYSSVIVDIEFIEGPAA